MSVQNINSSTAALNAQLLQSSTASDSGFSNSDLPQLSGSQAQQLQQALTQDIQQAFSGGGSTSAVQSQLDSSVSNTLTQAGFSDAQKQTVLDKINQALTGGGRAKHGHGHGHGRHRVSQVAQNLTQAVQNPSSSTAGQSSTSSTSGSTSAGGTASLIGQTTGGAGSSLDLTA